MMLVCSLDDYLRFPLYILVFSIFVYTHMHVFIFYNVFI